MFKVYIIYLVLHQGNIGSIYPKLFNTKTQPHSFCLGSLVHGPKKTVLMEAVPNQKFRFIVLIQKCGPLGTNLSSQDPTSSLSSNIDLRQIWSRCIVIGFVPVKYDLKQVILQNNSARTPTYPEMCSKKTNPHPSHRLDIPIRLRSFYTRKTEGDSAVKNVTKSES